MDIKKLLRSFLLLLTPVALAAITSWLLEGKVTNGEPEDFPPKRKKQETKKKEEKQG